VPDGKILATVFPAIRPHRSTAGIRAGASGDLRSAVRQSHAFNTACLAACGIEAALWLASPVAALPDSFMRASV
jgi:hypothetical protein